MSRKGNCYDNACIESFHSLLKKELVYQEKFKTRKDAKNKIFEYFLNISKYSTIANESIRRSGILHPFNTNVRTI